MILIVIVIMTMIEISLKGDVNPCGEAHPSGSQGATDYYL